jgi:protein SDA1
MADERLIELQAKVKKDPELYVETVDEIITEFNQLIDKFPEEPAANHVYLGSVSAFLCQVSPFFTEKLQHLPSTLLNILHNYYTALHREFRMTLFTSVLLLRNREQIPALNVLQLCFKMFRCQDKELRKKAFSHIISDIKRLNKKTQNYTLNKQIQNFIATMINDSNIIAAKKSLHVLMTLYKKRIWTDRRTVNVLADACLSREAKLVLIGCAFLLAADTQDIYSDEEDQEEAPDSEIKGARKTKGKVNERERKIKNYEKKIRRKERKQTSIAPSFLCIDQLNDPQAFIEKIFDNLQRNFNKGKYDLRVVMMQVISRIIGRHKLFLLDFYTYLMRYLNPKAASITQILITCAEAVHDLLPPTEVQPMVRKLIANFVGDHCTEESIILGLNTLREICKRQPLVMTPEMLGDMVGFLDYKNKGVVMAVRSLINFYRDTMPSLLPRKMRGFGGEDTINDYANPQVMTRVPGAEFLEKPLQEKLPKHNQVIRLLQPPAMSENMKRLEDKLKAMQQRDSKMVAQEQENEEGEESEESEESGEESYECSDEEILLGKGEEEVDSEEEVEESDEFDEEEESESEHEEEEEEYEENEDGVVLEEDADEDINEREQSESATKLRGIYQEEETKQEQPAPPAIPIECDYIFTQKDFQRIRQMQKEFIARKRRAERHIDDVMAELTSSSDEDNPHEFVQEDEINTSRPTKQDRRNESKLMREQYKLKNREKGGGKTHKQSSKNKPALMIIKGKKKSELKETVTSIKHNIKKPKQQKGHFNKRFKNS